MNGTSTCDRCGDEYDNYTVLLRDNFSDVAECVSEDYENLCKPCRAQLHPKQAFPDAADVTPKAEVETNA